MTASDIRKCFMGSLLLAGSFCWGQQVTLRLGHLPAETRRDSIYVAGSFNGWQPGNSNYRLTDTGSLVISATQGSVLEFKCTQGSWERVEVDAEGGSIQNRRLLVEHDTTLILDVEGWSRPGAGRLRSHTASKQVQVWDSAMMIPQLNRVRTVRVYLPPDYDTSSRSYPVLYLHDGQNVFDEYTSAYGEWKVDEALDSLYKASGKSIIVVAIDHGQTHRLTEYNPCNHERFGKGEGAAYASFVCRVLKPAVDKHFRTLAAPPFTWVAGSSMGGLISQYTAMAFPDVIGGAGIFSPAFWTCPDIYQQAGHYYAQQPRAALFFYAGAMESETMVAETQKMYDLASRSGNVKTRLVLDENGLHQEAAWAKWFHPFLQFMLAACENANAEAGK